MKSKLVAFFATLTFLALTSVAFAANVVVPAPTSTEPVDMDSDCAVAGGFTAGFDSGTTVLEGDSISFNLISPVTLCNSFDVLFAPTGNNSLWGVQAAEKGLSEANIAAAAADHGGFQRVYVSTNASEAVYTDQWTAVNTGSNMLGLQFTVKGTAGQSTVTLTAYSNRNANYPTAVGGEASYNRLEVNDVNGSGILFVRFLDGGTQNAWVDADSNGVYDTAATGDDNTLCINPNGFTGTSVTSHFYSPQGKYSFNPSNPENAHKGPAASATMSAVTTCVKDDGSLSCLAIPGSDQGDYCFFDFENSHSNDIWCSNNYTGNTIILQNTANFDTGQYSLTVELKVEDGTQTLTGDQGVYFVDGVAADSENGHIAFATTANCDYWDTLTGADIIGAPSAVATTGTVHYLANDALGTMGTDINDCTPAAAERVVKLRATEFAGSAAKFMYFNMPTMVIDSTTFPATASKIIVSVTLNDLPCDTFSADFDVACVKTDCSATTIPTTTSTTLTYPYFTEALDDAIAGGADPFQDGLVLINLSDADMTWTAQFYEADGDSFTYTPAAALPARQMFLNVLGFMLNDFVPVTTGPSSAGTIGDARSYAIVTADQNADGLGLVFDMASGVSMGYLPRVN